MATNVLQGSVLGVRIGDNWIRCQTDATLTLTKNLTTPDPCKPAPGESAASGKWNQPVVETKEWSIDFSAKTFADTTADGYSLSYVTQQFLQNDDPVEVVFQTNDELTDYSAPLSLLYTGEGLLSSLTVNAPGTGESTYDTTITGVGEILFEEVPVTT